MPNKRPKVKNAQRRRQGFEEIREVIRDLTIGIKELKDGIKELKESQKKTDEQMKKTDEQIKRTDKQIGNLTDGWGKFVEGLVAPSISVVFKKLGIEIDDVAPRRKKYRDGKVMEVDVLALGKKGKREVALVVEVKSSLESRHIDEFLKEISNFSRFFTEYAEREVYGVVAGIRLGDGVERYAEKHGLYVLAPSGETMVLLNKKSFKPRIWR